MAKEILIADSDTADREELQRIFKTTDYHLIFSETGEEALLRAKLFKPDVIIASGTNLREMGGLELCGTLKGDSEFKHIPFILISNMFDEISEGDRKRSQADGVISTPLNEDEVLNLVNQLMKEEKIEEETVEETEELIAANKSPLLDETGGGTSPVIELLDVVEEPEPQLGIDSFVGSGKEKQAGKLPEEIAPFEPWEGTEGEEKSGQREWMQPPAKEGGIPKEEEFPPKHKSPLKETLSKVELFEKIELQEILDKVEQLKPIIEKEWPPGLEVRSIEKIPSKAEDPSEKLLDLKEFEAVIQDRIEGDEKKTFIPPEELKRISDEAVSIAESLGITEGEGREQPLFKEESLAAGEEVIEEETIMGEETEEVLEESFPDQLFEDLLKEAETKPTGGREGLRWEEAETRELRPGGAKPDLSKEAESSMIFEEEMLPAEEAVRGGRTASPLTGMIDKNLENVLEKGIQSMVADFITKILPEMTQHIIGLTAERIEKMVKDVVPNLAEKAIREEIKRLQKEEKE